MLRRTSLYSAVRSMCSGEYPKIDTVAEAQCVRRCLSPFRKTAPVSRVTFGMAVPTGNLTQWQSVDLSPDPAIDILVEVRGGETHSSNRAYSRLYAKQPTCGADAL